MGCETAKSTPSNADLYRVCYFVSSVLQYSEVETVSCIHWRWGEKKKDKKGEKLTFWEVEGEEFILIPLKLFSCWKLLDLDGLSQLSYRDNLSYCEDDHVSVDSRATIESKGTGQHKGPRMESSTADGVSQQATEGRLEMETAFTNQGFEVNDATDSSSAWTPEVWWIVIYYIQSKILKDVGGQKMLGEKRREKLISTAQDNGTSVCMCAWTYTSFPVFPLFLVFYLLLLTLIQRSCVIAWFLSAISELKLEPLAAWQHLLSFSNGPGLCYWLYVQGNGVWSLGQLCASFSGWFLWLRQWEASGKLEAAGGGGLWLSQVAITPVSIDTRHPSREGESLRAPLLSLSSVPLFWSLKKALKILRHCKHPIT